MREQDAPLAVGLEHEPEVAGLQIAQTAVHQPAGARAGPRAEVVLLDEHGPEARAWPRRAPRRPR